MTSLFKTGFFEELHKPACGQEIIVIARKTSHYYMGEIGGPGSAGRGEEGVSCSMVWVGWVSLRKQQLKMERFAGQTQDFGFILSVKGDQQRIF